MLYTLETIQAILIASGYPLGIPQHVERNTFTPQPMTYFYPPSPVTTDVLLQESQNYLQGHLQANAAHRVCFLLPATSPPYGALILEFSPTNPEVAKAILSLAKAKTPLSPTDWAQRMIWYQSLYTDINCYLVGEVGDSAAWIALLRYAFRWVRIKIQPVMANTHIDIVFMECLLTLLRGETIRKVDGQQVLATHQRICVNAVMQRLIGLVQSHPVQYATITADLRALFKYAALHALRQRYPTTASPEELNRLSQRDKHQKYFIYSQSIADLRLPLQELSLESLVTLLPKPSMADWQAHLTTKRKRQQADLIAWEQAFEQRCQAQGGGIWVSAQSVMGALYHYSLVGLGAELTLLLAMIGSHALSHTTGGQRFVQAVTQTIPSPYLRRAGHLLGGTLGALGHYVLGSYFLGKSLLTGVLAQKLKEAVTKPQFNDETATVTSPWAEYLSEPLSIIRVVGVLVACLETGYSGYYPYLLQVLGGALGSVGMVKLAKCLLPQGASTTEEHTLALWFLGIAGYEMGELLAQMGYEGIDKGWARETVEQVFCTQAEKQGWEGCTADFRTPAYSSSFWLKANDEVRLGWTTTPQQKQFWEVDCEVVKLTTGERTVVCDVPKATCTLRLGN